MKILLRTVIIILLLFVSTVPVYANEAIDQQIKDLEAKIAASKSEQNTLSKQITLLDSQIKLTELQIASTEKKVDVLEREIGELADEIHRLEDLKTKRLELVLHRIPQSYKRTSSSQFGWLLFSKNFSDLLTRAKYIVQVQEDYN